MSMMHSLQRRRSNLEVVKGGAVNKDTEPQSGTHWTPIFAGLVDPRHCAQMDDALWLYLYLHEQATFTKGIVTQYTHKKASEALGLPERTIVRRMARLVKFGYVVLKQGQHDATVTITRFKGAKDTDALRSGTPILATLNGSGTPEVASLDQPRVATYDREDSHNWRTHPYIEPKDSITTTNVVGADAPPAPAQNHEPPAPPSQSKRAPKQRDPDAPGQAAFTIAQALIEARGEDLEVARKRGALGKYLKQVDALIIGPYAGKGLTAKKVCSCIAYLLTEPRFQDADGRDRFSPALLAEKLGPWLAAKEPARYVDPAKRSRPPKPTLAPPPPPEPGSWQERVQAAQAEKVRLYRAEMRAQGIDLPEWST